MTPQEILDQFGPRESMEYDVVVVGAGPAGLATVGTHVLGSLACTLAGIATLPLLRR